MKNLDVARLGDPIIFESVLRYLHVILNETILEKCACDLFFLRTSE